MKLLIPSLAYNAQGSRFKVNLWIILTGINLIARK
jgi:hypothetical protein